MKKRRYRINIRLTFFVFLILFLSNVMIVAILVLLYLLGVISEFHAAPLWVGILSLAASLLVSTVGYGFFALYFFRPLNELIAATKRVASGDFSVQVKEPPAGSVRAVNQGEINALIRSFNEMTKELASVEMFRKDFISNFSHEFKTPIISIRGFARQLKQGNLTDAQREEFTKIIADESEYLADMSANVLFLTKLENQKIVTDRRPFSLDEQLRDCMLLLESHWSEKNLDVAMELESVTYTQNPELLSHVWKNLLSNAIKFTPPGGCITVSCVKENHGVSVTVSDTGIGMTEETMAHMFEKFYQGDPSHAEAGNGLGLSLAARVIELCGGTIQCESRPHEGTTFVVFLPE